MVKTRFDRYSKAQEDNNYVPRSGFENHYERLGGCGCAACDCGPAGAQLRRRKQAARRTLCAAGGLPRGCHGPRPRQRRFSGCYRSTNPRHAGAVDRRPGSLAGKYFGNEDPGDPATCPVPTAANPGTLCSFFKYVAGSFQPGNKWVSLSPAYKTHFEIDDNTATGYSECHYFDVSVDPATGNPRWQAKAHLPWDVNLEKVEGKWLLSRINPVPPIGIPVP
jgi:hypothetical protein